METGCGDSCWCSCVLCAADRDLDQDGHVDDDVTCGGDDCDDRDPATYGGAPEVVDGRDNNCDGTADEGTTAYDDDGDGYCEGFQCADGSLGGDCDDTSDAISPGLTEVCGNAVDEDCSGDFEDLDADDDGVVAVACGGMDCADDDALVGPNRTEDCATVGVDDDCSGVADDLDADFDTYVTVACGGTDCDDADLLVNPGALERCDGQDTDCDGTNDNRDIDMDGFVEKIGCGGTDCNDLDPNINPNIAEVPDQIDNDCNGIADDGTIFYDDDGDGHCESLSCTDGSLPGDCDDQDITISPSAPELCDRMDNDCDPTTDEEVDGDGDGFALCDGDCDDQDGRTGPLSQEICSDAVDNDCDGELDESSCIVCTVTVPTDVATVQGALDASSDGDTICLDAGTFTENVDWGAHEVTVVGLFGPSETILTNAVSALPTVRFGAALVDAELRGVTCAAGYQAPAIDIRAGSPRLRDVITTLGGPGVFIDGGGAPSLDGVVIQDAWGNGIFVVSASPEIRRTTVSGSRTSSVAFNGTGHLRIADTDLDGGLRGLFVLGNGAPQVDLVRVSITGHGDGGIRLDQGMVRLVDSRVVDNTASSGGGIAVTGGSLVLVDVYLGSNTADRGTGGGLRLRPGLSDPVTIDSVNLTASGNLAEEGGGGIAIERGATQDVWGTMVDTEINGSTSHADAGGMLLVDTDVQLRGVNLMNTLSYGDGSLTISGGAPTITDLRAEYNQSDGGTWSVVRVADGADVVLNGVHLIEGGLSTAAGTILAVDNGLFVDEGGVFGDPRPTLAAAGQVDLAHVLFANAPVDGVISSRGALSLRNGMVVGSQRSLLLRGGTGNIDAVAVTGNSSFDSSGILVQPGVFADVRNTIVTDNQATNTGAGGIQDDGSLTIAYSDVWGNAPTDGVVTALSADPLFLDRTNPDSSHWDLHLDPSSPAVDAGDPTVLDPDGSPSDMGPFGGPDADGWDLDRDGFFGWWQPGPYQTATYPAAGWDCNDRDPSVHPGAVDRVADGVDSNCNGLDDAVCAGSGPGTDAVGGFLRCAGSPWDAWEVAVTDGDCVQVAADNHGEPADLVLQVVHPDGTTVEFDNDVACSTAPWNAMQCPEAAFIASGTGSVTVRVRQVDGVGCPDHALFTLTAAVNGLAASPQYLADDVP